MDGTDSEEPLEIPDWCLGARTRANALWVSMVKNKTQADIEEVSNGSVRGARYTYLHIYRIVWNSMRHWMTAKGGS